MTAQAIALETSEIDAGAYRIRTGIGVRHELAALLRAHAPVRHVAIISDEHVAALHAPAIAGMLGDEFRLTSHVMKAGEDAKSVDSWLGLSQELLGAHADRATIVLALGGGVVTDLAGFVAATFMRGVRVLHVPTTLLAMVDAAIGGKTGVNMGGGKNLVGSFHEPVAVCADLELLATLPRRELLSGAAEMLKHGLIADAQHFDALSLAALNDVELLAPLVARSQAIKCEIVRNDPAERSERVWLNAGHSIGHAVESASGFRLLHGEAVAIGLSLEAEIAERLGVAEPGVAHRIVERLDAVGLPTRLPGDLDIAVVQARMAADKKNEGEELRFALPVGIGRMFRSSTGEYTVPVPASLLREVLQCR